MGVLFRNNKRVVRGLLFFAFLGFSMANAEVVNVYLLGGQSNMRGRGAGVDFDLKYQTPPLNVTYYNGGVLASLVPNSSEFYGPEISFAHAISEADPSQKSVLIKYARGGTSLFEDWVPGKTGTTYKDGYDYRVLQKQVRRVLRELRRDNPADTFNVVGFLWVQGEKDAKQGRKSGQYRRNLRNFITDIRLTYGNIPFYYSRLSDGAVLIPRAFAIQRAQDVVNGEVADTHLINTDDLTLFDGVHYDAASQTALGIAFASLVY